MQVSSSHRARGLSPSGRSLLPCPPGVEGCRQQLSRGEWQQPRWLRMVIPQGSSPAQRPGLGSAHFCTKWPPSQPADPLLFALPQGRSLGPSVACPERSASGTSSLKARFEPAPEAAQLRERAIACHNTPSPPLTIVGSVSLPGVYPVRRASAA